MKKLLTVCLAALMAVLLAVPALADVIWEPIPQPEGGDGTVTAVVIAAVIVVIAAAVVVTLRIRKKRRSAGGDRPQ